MDSRNDEKKDYIIKQLGRTHKKNFENYCITRIFHKLDRLDVKFVTQQLFKRNDGKIALADLYLPQTNMIIEVDEPPHDGNKEKDEAREEEIIANKINYFEEIVPYELKIERIDCNEKASIEEISQQIDELVCIIKQKIDGLGDKFVPWNETYPTPQDYIKKGYIDIKDNPSFKTIQEVSELFNKGYKKTQRNYFSDQEGSNIKVWCPKLAINGIEYKVPYRNEISADGKTIYESTKNEEDNASFVDGYLNGKSKNLITRYAFTYYRDSSGEDRYRFRGVFQLDKEKTKMQQKRVWDKTSERVDLTIYKSESKKTKQEKAKQR